MPDNILQTERLLLRQWQNSDANALFKYASDPRVGPNAGWPIHKSEAHSLEIIQTVLSAPETYAIVIKETNEPIGSIGLMMGEYTDLTENTNEAELGYWIGVPYWGQGLITEASKEIIRYGFESLKLNAIWCGYFSHNTRSGRVQEKCGFLPHHIEFKKHFPLIDQIYDEQITLLTKTRWMDLIKTESFM